MSSLPAGWYKDPADPSTQRWWDGEGWLGEAIPADQKPPAGPPTEEPQEEAKPAAPVAPPPPTWGPPPGYPTQPPGYPTPPPGYPVPPPGHPMPPGYPVPPPGWQPPPGWTPPPGLMYPYPVQARPHGMALAGLGRRLVARLVDFAAVLILNVLVNGWLAYQWWLEVEPIFRAAMTEPFSSPQPASARSTYLMLTMLFVATALWFAYEVPAVANSGQTLGKRLLQVKVVKLEDTTAIGFGRAFRRWGRLGMWTPLWNCYGIGFLAQLIDCGYALFDQRLHQALHDKSAGTVVVAVPPGRPQQSVPAVPGADKSTGGER